jgi:hypothetical protein
MTRRPGTQRQLAVFLLASVAAITACTTDAGEGSHGPASTPAPVVQVTATPTASPAPTSVPTPATAPTSTPSAYSGPAPLNSPEAAGAYAAAASTYFAGRKAADAIDVTPWCATRPPAVGPDPCDTKAGLAKSIRLYQLRLTRQAAALTRFAEDVGAIALPSPYDQVSDDLVRRVVAYRDALATAARKTDPYKMDSLSIGSMPLEWNAQAAADDLRKQLGLRPIVKDEFDRFKSGRF